MVAHPCLIAVAGLPGSGKSTVARLIAHSVDGLLLRSDEIRKQLFPRPTYTPAEGAQVYARLFALADQGLSQGQSVVLDATFHQSDLRQQAQKIAETHALPWRFILVTAPPALVHSRLALRQGDASDADFTVYQSMQARFVPMQGAYDRIHNDGDLPALEAQTRALLKGEWMQG
jgi:predicted kinase